MKRLRSVPARRSAQLVGCTVSAAALMLGVTQAATVGFNFQTHYCAANSYSGAVVTAPAFGIGTNAWESLMQMDTGYGCTAGYYTLDQVIDTTSSGGGLNPLPSGSVHVTWSAYTANVSGFGGYDRPGPHYTFGGNGYKPGNEQVYWGFLRDGVNFGPGSSGGDNNQPGYTIDITGLNSVFTNGEFAVELIGSADSMQYLTNAFIIDATLSTTQTVYYPSTPPVNDSGDTAWIRGIGGGLSTASGALSTDHLKIIGNRAAHVGPKTGYNFASTIAGFILTDKPVISMPPNSVQASPADTIALSAYAVGVPPMSYQWRQNGQPVAGATTTTLSIASAGLADAGNYDLVVTNQYGSVTSSVAVVTVDHIIATSGNNYLLDSNPQNVEYDALNSGATWLASSTDGGNTTRLGVMSFNAASSNQITVPVGTTFDSPTGTIMFWVRSSGLADPAGNPAMLFDRRNGLHGSGCVIVQNTDGSVLFQTDNGNNSLGSPTSISDNNWHQVAVTYDQSLNGQLTLYIDGVLSGLSFTGTAWTWRTGQPIELGLSNDTADWQPLNGQMDDVRVYNRILSDTEIASAYSGALVDNAALVLRLNFDAAPTTGVTLQWQCPDATLQMSPNAGGTYTDLPGVLSPYAASAQGAARFFRYHGHTPVSLLSNPYMM